MKLARRKTAPADLEERRARRANPRSEGNRRRWLDGKLPAVVAILLLALVCSIPAPGRTGTSAGPGRYAIASETARATNEGMSILRAGGNAADAAVAVALVAGVVNPTSSGLGGGGFVTYWDAVGKRPLVLDFREVAPLGLEPSAFEKRPFAASERGRYVGVPGEVAGLFELHRRFGQQPWAKVVDPAIRVARDGFVVEPHLARMIAAETDDLRADPALFSWLFPGGRPTSRGSRLTNLALAETLERIAQLGPWGFYQGVVAADIVETARAAGSPLTLADLGRYRVSERRPLALRWEGYDLYTMPPPSAGGIMLAQVLRLFSRAELVQAASRSGEYHHLLAEAMRGAFADRFRYVGDPDHHPVPTAILLGDEHIARRKARIDPMKTHTIAEFLGQEHGTHHFSVFDGSGNLLSLTTTVNRGFGAKLLTRSGFLLNDELDDFTLERHARALGVTSSPNRPRPLARPVSSMTPTIVVRDQRAVLGIGGSGGMRIAPNVTQVLAATLGLGLEPQAAVAAPRFALPFGGATLALDPSFGPDLARDLAARGEIVKPLADDTSAVQLVWHDGSRLRAASDPRKSGLARVE